MVSSSSNKQATTQTDNRRVLGEGAISAESGATVSVLDNGAISKAFDFSSAVAAGALKFGLDSQSSTAGILKDAYADAKGRGALTDYILIGSIAMAGLIAFQALKK